MISRNSMKLIFIAILTTFSFLLSCKNKDLTFDKAGWNYPCDGLPCPVLRDRMIDDLLENHKVTGLTYNQVISKLGNTDNHEQTPSGIMRYEISTDYTMGDIVHIKALDLYYDKDSIVTSWKLVNFDVDM